MQNYKSSIFLPPEMHIDPLNPGELNFNVVQFNFYGTLKHIYGKF